MPTKLTSKLIEKLKAPETGRLEMRDSEAKGLMLRVTGNGMKSWSVFYVRLSDGKDRRVTIGEFTGDRGGMSLGDARQAAREVRRRVEQGEDPASDKVVRRAADTFTELSEAWMERYARTSKSEAALYDDELMLKKDVLPAIGAMKAAEVKKRDVVRLVESVAGRGAKVRANRVLSLVRTIYRWGMEKDEVAIDPTLGIKAAEEPTRSRVLNDSEIKLLWAGLDKAPMSDAVRLIVKLCLVTAQRRQEVACIDIRELDMNPTAPLWTIPGDETVKGKLIEGRTKNGLTHEVPLSPMAVELLVEALKLREVKRLALDVKDADMPWLFPNPNGSGPIDPHAVTRAVTRMRALWSGVENFTVHDLRRTAATGMGKLGGGKHKPFISNVLNHARQDVTGIYDRSEYNPQKLAALTDWSMHLSALVMAALTNAGTEPAADVRTAEAVA